MKKNVIYIPNNKDDEYKINFNEHKKEKKLQYVNKSLRRSKTGKIEELICKYKSLFV